MKHPCKTRASGAAVTVFVPYDCGNHCPFCINKDEYASPEGFSAEKICESISRMDRTTPYRNFVFTGGEPLANLKSLQRMIDKIPATHKIYIDTTLPVSAYQSDKDIIVFARKTGRRSPALTSPATCSVTSQSLTMIF